MPAGLIDTVMNEVGADKVTTTKETDKTGSVKDNSENGYSSTDDSYGSSKGEDKSDLSSTSTKYFSAYQKSFIMNRLSSNAISLRAIIDIFRKFAKGDVDSMIAEIYPEL